jgi:hypothetical protein
VAEAPHQNELDLEDPVDAARPLLTPRKVVIQVLFWLIGIGLLAWIIHGAVWGGGGDWERVFAADWRLVAALIGCTLISTLLNGATFWVTIQSVRRVRMFDMQMLNLVGNMLNYAPIRAGAIARVLYHHRVDRLGLLQIGGWFAMIGYVLVLGVGACFIATLLRESFDLLWALLVVGQMALGALAMQVIAGHPLIVRHGRGIDRILRDHRALWGAVGLRLADIAAFTGRMAAALAILGIALPTSHIVVLAMVALAASLVPFGRLGFREFAVVLAAPRLGGMAEADLPWEQLALIESAGEALFFIPAGAIAMLWYRARWRAAGRRDVAA